MYIFKLKINVDQDESNWRQPVNQGPVNQGTDNQGSTVLMVSLRKMD